MMMKRGLFRVRGISTSDPVMLHRHAFSTCDPAMLHRRALCPRLYRAFSTCDPAHAPRCAEAGDADAAAARRLRAANVQAGRPFFVLSLDDRRSLTELDGFIELHHQLNSGKEHH